VQERRSEQKFRRRGFTLGVFAGVLFLVFKLLKYPGSIDRRDALLCLALILSMGLVGGLVGLALGKIFGPSDRDD
jgi:hypothetical protein